MMFDASPASSLAKPTTPQSSNSSDIMRIARKRALLFYSDSPTLVMGFFLGGAISRISELQPNSLRKTRQPTKAPKDRRPTPWCA